MLALSSSETYTIVYQLQGRWFDPHVATHAVLV